MWWHWSHVHQQREAVVWPVWSWSYCPSRGQEGRWRVWSLPQANDVGIQIQTKPTGESAQKFSVIFAIILVHFCRTILDVLTTKQLLTHSSCWCDLRLYNVHDVSCLFEYSSNLQAMFCPVMMFIRVLKVKSGTDMIISISFMNTSQNLETAFTFKLCCFIETLYIIIFCTGGTCIAQ